MKKRTPRLSSHFLLLLTVSLLLLTGCDSAIKLPSFFSPSRKTMLAAVVAKFERIPGGIVTLQGEDIVFTLSERSGSVSSYVTSVFNQLESLAVPNSLLITIESETTSSPSQAGTRANELILDFENNETREELSYRVEFTYRAAAPTTLILEGELVFHNLYPYVLMGEDEFLEWKLSRQHITDRVDHTNGITVIYHSWDGEELLSLNALTQPLWPDVDDLTYSIGGSTISSLDLSDGASTFIVNVSSSSESIEEAVIIKIGSVSVGTDTSVLYTIEDALKIAQNQEVFVRSNTSFASADVAIRVYESTEHRIGSSTTLVLPYDEHLSSGVSDNPGEKKTAGPLTRNSEYVRLTVPSGITVNLKGRLVVNALRAANNTKFQGHVTGSNYSLLVLEEDSSLNIEYRGELYALGFIEGSGSINALNGSYIYEGLFISSFRGGSASVRIEDKVFPFDQFTVAQIKTPLTIHQGASYIAKALIYVSEKYRSGDFPLVGSNGIIRLQNGTVKKTYDNGVVTLTINGKCSMNNSRLKAGSVTASTEGRVIPFDGTWNFIIESGSDVTLDTSIALLPGASLSIESGATLTVKKPNTFTIFTWKYKDDYNSYPNGGVLDYYREEFDHPNSSLDNALVTNKGSLIVESGAGIAGKVSGFVDLEPDALTEYPFYRVEGSGKEAEAVEYTVSFEDD